MDNTQQSDNGSPEGDNGHPKENGGNHTMNNGWSVIWSILKSAAFWTALFTGFLTVFTYKLWKVSQATNETSKATQRAYVNFSGVGNGTKVTSDDRKKLVDIQLSFNWFNSGSTPARKAVTWVSYQPWPHELPKGFDFPDLGKIDYRVASLGPRDTGGPTALVPISDIAEQKAGKERLYFWGWVVYNDAFPDDPDRLSEFCVELTQIVVMHQDKAIDDPANDFDWSRGQTRCPEHNCFDKDCPDYNAKVKSVREAGKQ